MKRTKKSLLSGVEKPHKTARLLCGNTLKIEYEDGSTAIRFHDTDIITRIGEKTILNTNGFKTNTTKERISEFSDFHIKQNDWKWYVHGKDGKIYDFYDGMEFKNGIPLKEKHHKGTNRIKKLISEYGKEMKKMKELPPPDNGDCLVCRFGLGGNDHLISHIEEKYIHGSLIVTAMKDCGYGHVQISTHYHMKLYDSMIRITTRYLKKNLMRG